MAPDRSPGVLDALKKIEDSLLRLERRILFESLRPGLESGKVEIFLETIGLDAPESLRDLYGWRDGTSTAGILRSGDINLFPGFYLLSLEDAIINYHAFVTHERWDSKWLPIFANGGGDFYVADFGEPGRPFIRHFRIAEIEQPIEHSGLQEMLSTFAAAYREGVIFADEERYLDMDYAAFDNLAAKMNSSVAWWSE